VTTIDETGAPVDGEEEVPAAAGASPAQDVQLLLALLAMQHGLDVEIKDLRSRVAAQAVETWREQNVAPTFRHELGSASLRLPKDAVAVVDDDALLDWVLEHHEDEVEVVTRVRPAYVRALLARLKIAGGVVVDKESGEVVDIPGVSVVAGGDPSVMGVTLTADTKATAEAIVRARLHQLAAYALPAAGGDGG
jgi:hypothetical protein